MIDEKFWLVEELFRSIRAATKTLGRPPTSCELARDEWRELVFRFKPQCADPGWHVKIMGVPVVPLRPLPIEIFAADDGGYPCR